MDDEAAVADEDKMKNEGQRPFGGRAAAQGAELTAEQKQWMEVAPHAAAHDFTSPPPRLDSPMHYTSLLISDFLSRPVR